MGKYNKDKTGALLMVGNGTADNDRSNAFEVMSNGNANIAGNTNIAGDANIAGTLTVDSMALDVNLLTALTSYHYELTQLAPHYYELMQLAHDLYPKLAQLLALVNNIDNLSTEAEKNCLKQRYNILST